MADIELVIKLPEELKEALDNAKKENAFNYMRVYNDTIYGAIKNGIPLPKGHGRIGDLDSIMNDISNSINEMTNIGIGVDGEYLWGKLNDAIDNAQPIIPADKEFEEEAEEELCK